MIIVTSIIKTLSWSWNITSLDVRCQFCVFLAELGLFSSRVAGVGGGGGVVVAGYFLQRDQWVSAYFLAKKQQQQHTLVFPGFRVSFTEELARLRRTKPNRKYTHRNVYRLPYSLNKKDWICSLFKEWILEKSEIRVNLEWTFVLFTHFGGTSGITRYPWVIPVVTPKWVNNTNVHSKFTLISLFSKIHSLKSEHIHSFSFREYVPEKITIGLSASTGAREHFEFWRGKISKGAHLSEVLGEGAKRPSGGRVWPPSHGRDFFKIESLKVAFVEHLKTIF